jgi:hypothetical protein
LANRSTRRGGLVGPRGANKGSRSTVGKFSSVRLLGGRLPKSYEPHIQSKKLEDGNIEFSFDDKTVALIKKALRLSVSAQKQLRFHLYSVLLVYAWAAFETYLSMLLDDLYRSKPELLKSREVLTFEQAIANRDDILTHLIHEQLARFGSLNLKDRLKYIDDRINFRFNPKVHARLSEYYFVRNVVAHNTGLVSPNRLQLIPDGLQVVRNELRITHPYLKNMLRQLRAAVTAMEKHAIKKFLARIVNDHQGTRVAPTSPFMSATANKPRHAMDRTQ